MRTSGKTNTALLASPVYIGQAQGGEKKKKKKKKPYKKRSQRAVPFFSSHLRVGMPSRLKDVFSCYFLNKIELQHGAVTLIVL